MSNLMTQRGSTELLDIARSNPLHALEGRRSLIENPQPGDSNSLAVPLELRETDDGYILRVEVAGVRRECLRVTCSDRMLVIAGERREDREGSVRYTERLYGAFSRSITLPATILHDSVRAWYIDGVLEILLPKARKTLSHSAE